MTQQCKHDEQLLDFVYGELSDAERKIFAEHLAGCSACSAQVESFGRVRKEFQQRPPIEPVGESMQRMTALLMQAAAAGAAGKGSTGETGGGGKLLAFRSRGLRRILFHPAGGVMAVAAAAMFWVVFRTQPAPQLGLPTPLAPSASFETASPSRPPPTVEAAPAAAPAAKPVNDPAGPNPADPAVSSGFAARKLEQQTRHTGLATDKSGSGDAVGSAGDFDGLRGGTATVAKDIDARGYRAAAEKKPAPPSSVRLALEKPMAPAPTKPTALANLDALSSPAGMAAGGKGGTPARDGAAQYRQGNAGPAVVAMADQAYAKSAKKEASVESERPQDRWAQPPAAEPPAPPPVQAAPAVPQQAADDEDNSVHRAIARTQEQRKQKVVEELANQQLGSLGTNVAPAPAPESEGRYAQRPASSAPYKADTAASNYGNRASAGGDAAEAPPMASTPAMQAAGMPGRSASYNNLADDGAAALAAAKEQLRRGQCAEANTALTKLERSLPATRGLADTRAEWQSACAAQNQQLLERRQHYEAPELAAPQAAQYRSKMKMASPAPMPAKAPPRSNKAAKPAERGAAKAADLAL